MVEKIRHQQLQGKDLIITGFYMTTTNPNLNTSDERGLTTETILLLSTSLGQWKQTPEYGARELNFQKLI